MRDLSDTVEMATLDKEMAEERVSMSQFKTLFLTEKIVLHMSGSCRVTSLIFWF